MLRKGLLFAALVVLPTVAAFGQTARGPFELTLGGTGANGPNFDGFSAAVNGSLGYYFNDNLELSVRQSFAYSDIAGRSWDASTRVALDYHFILGDQGQIQPFVGGNIGYVYGDSVHDTWEAAPEAGIKWYVNAATFVYFSVEYQFFFDQHSNSTAFSDGQFIYGLGIGFRF